MLLQFPPKSCHGFNNISKLSLTVGVANPLITTKALSCISASKLFLAIREAAEQ